MAKISVIIPCFNQEQYIKECLESVLAQTFQDYEIIVINDGSTDNSLAVIQEYQNNYPDKIKVINQENQGVVIARNKAIEQASGEYIFPLDGDDKITPDCLEKLYSYREKADVIYSKVYQFGALEGEMVLKYPSIWNMCMNNQIVVSCLYRKSDWVKYKGYDPNMKEGLEDWEFWLNFVADRKKFFCIPERLFNYRIIPNSRNQKVPDKKLREYIYTKHPKVFRAYILSVIRRFFYQKKITKSGCLIIKICKIPVYWRKANVANN